MKVEIRPATLRDCTFVAANMRDQDHRELTAILDESRVSLGALCFLSAPDTSWCAWLDGSPIAAFGFSPGVMPHTCWSAWAYGTKRMRRAIPAISRHGQRVVAPMLIDRGVLRVEVRSIADHDIAHQWLAGLGAAPECRLEDYGLNGETFILYAWTRSRYVPVRKPPRSPASPAAGAVA